MFEACRPTFRRGKRFANVAEDVRGVSKSSGGITDAFKNKLRLLEQKTNHPVKWARGWEGVFAKGLAKTTKKNNTFYSSID